VLLQAAANAAAAELIKRIKMSRRSTLCSVLLWSVSGLLLVSAAIPARAGNKDVPQWGLEAFKIHTPTDVGDAASVVLFDEYVETIDIHGRAVEREREAIRILKPQGRNESCGVSYDVDEKINYFRAWTIGADEKQYEAKDTDFVDRGESAGHTLLFTERYRLVRPPAADVGATIICESEEMLAPYAQEKVWHMQQSTPFASEALEIDLPPGMKYAANWHRYDAVQPVEVAPNHWRWELKNVNALDLRDVKASPTWTALAGRVSVQWGEAAVEGKENQWKALGVKYTDLEAHRADPTPEITAKAQQLVSGAPDFYAKLKGITEYIQKNIEYFVVERGIGGWQSHYANDIFHNRYGDCKDKTTLLISMLQAAGIQAFYVPVDDRRGVIDPDAPSFYGDHMITAIKIPAEVKDPRLMAIATAKDGTRYLIFDPTNERTPVGNLPEYEQGSYGLLAAGDASQVIALPVLAPEANGEELKGTFTLAADGALSGTVQRMSIGPAGADVRGMLKATDEKQRRESLEKEVAADLPGVSLSSFEFKEPPDLEKPLELNLNVTAPRYAKQAGPLVLVRARVMGDRSRPFDDKQRKVPINLNASGRWHDSFDITLPEGYAVDELPDSVSVDMDFASYHSSATAKGNVLHYERELVVRQVEMPATRAADYRKFEGAITQDELGSAVLKRR
jgi:Domain of Unknown Function with PDB structure (DUF3857)/Transglutaminase-like superfamily